MFTRLLLIGLVSVSCIAAQATKAELLGVVRDPSRSPASGVAVELRNTATGATATTSTDVDGKYQFVGVPAGPYRLMVTNSGFAPLQRDGLILRVGDRLELDLTLALGDVSETIEVTASAPLLKSTRGGVGYVVDQQRVVTLPLDGRNFVPLIALLPGVSLPPGSVLPRINGSRPRVSEYIYDGISVLQPEPGQVALYPIVDAIEEFRVETNSYSAEYGRSNGGVIMVHQKSGSNDLHGTLFEFLRNEKLNARNLFATTGPTPRFRRNQFGFVLGGPIRKNRTFFFTDWQRTHLDTGVVRISTVPTAAQRQGVFNVPIFDPASREPFPNSTVPATRFDPVARRLLERYPLPNVPNASANNFRRTGSDRTQADQFDGRIDHHIRANQRVFARYSFLRDRSTPLAPLPDGSGNLTSGVIGDTLTRADSVGAEHSWTLTPAAVNQLRFGFTRRGFRRNSMGDLRPTYDITGLQQLGPPASANAEFTTSVTQFVDVLAIVRGRNSLKVGADIRLQTLDVLQPPSPAGSFQFTSILTAGLTPAGSVIANTGSSFASFVLGQVSRYSLDDQPEVLRPRARVAEFFVQDDVRASRTLTLNVGVRYTMNFPSTVLQDRGAVFNLATQQLDFPGSNGKPRTARDFHKTNFGPRIGLAWKAAESFVIRSGYGLTWIEQAGITTPFTTPLFPFIQTIGQQALDNVNPAFTLSNGPAVSIQPPGANSGLGQGVFAVQRDNGSGYAQQWNLSLQKTIGENWSLEAGYLGSKLTRLGVPDVNLNQLTAEQLALGPQLLEQVANPFFGQLPGNSPLGAPTVARAQLLRPYPRFTTVSLYRNNVGHSTYHSFQSRVEKRFSAGLTFSASYTFSRLIDDAGAVFDSAILTGPVTNFQAADSHNKKLEKDVSTGNIPHIFSSGFVYEAPFLPGRWQLAGIARLQSGSPVAVTQATNLNAFAGFGIQRPNRIADPTLPSQQRTTGRWFDTAAFRQAPQFMIGNSSRNPVTGPGYRTLDVMLGKTFAVRERVRAEFRIEAFNVTNTPTLGNPNGSFGAAAFGSITTALDPRVFECVVKLHF